MKEPVASRILKAALYAMLVLGVIGTVTMPVMLDTYAYLIHGASSLQEAYRAFILPFLMFVAIPCLWIVLEMIGMMRTIPTGPFVMRNVRALKRIGLLCFLLAAAFLGKCLFFFTFLTAMCGIFFTGGGLAALTFAALISQSTALREENELTI